MRCACLNAESESRGSPPGQRRICCTMSATGSCFRRHCRWIDLCLLSYKPRLEGMARDTRVFALLVVLDRFCVPMRPAIYLVILRRPGLVVSLVLSVLPFLFGVTHTRESGAVPLELHMGALGWCTLKPETSLKPRMNFFPAEFVSSRWCCRHTACHLSHGCHRACLVTRGDSTFRLRQHTAGVHLQAWIFDAPSFSYREVTERVIIVTVSPVSLRLSGIFDHTELLCTES